MNIVNLTTHPIHLYPPSAPDTVTGADTPLRSIPPSGTVARLAVTPGEAATVHVAGLDVPLQSSVYGAAQHVPDPEPGTLYLIALSLAMEMRRTGRVDLIVVDRLVRNDADTVVGCRGFGRALDATTADTDGYTYPYKDPRGILAGNRWEDLVDGQLVSVQRLGGDFGTVAVRVRAELAHLHGEIAGEMREALGYALQDPQPADPPEAAPRSGRVIYGKIAVFDWVALLSNRASLSDPKVVHAFYRRCHDTTPILAVHGFRRPRHLVLGSAHHRNRHRAPQRLVADAATRVPGRHQHGPGTCLPAPSRGDHLGSRLDRAANPSGGPGAHSRQSERDRSGGPVHRSV
ncbi:hypothetical protein [Sphaerisporangium album]|uniref:hypothetical protein n=1 Tax=Sphaerisporangium album TaxID=509200 RepID=UPI0011C03A3A|nr:hypothetical protein [Sphaerisporangium album]